MEYSILDAKGDVIGTATNAREAKAKLERGRCVFGSQTVLDGTGEEISENALESLCADETATENSAA